MVFFYGKGVLFDFIKSTKNVDLNCIGEFPHNKNVAS